MTSPDVVEIAPSLYRLRIPGGPAHALNSYLWLGSDSVSLFDTGWAGSEVLIKAALKHLDRSQADVGHVVLSHFHEDHAGAAAAISRWPHVEIVVSALEASAIRGDTAGPLPHLTSAERQIQEQPSEPPAARACVVGREVNEGDVLPFGNEAVVIATPGHTHGSLALHLPRLNAVLTGDTVAELNGDVVLGVFNVDRELTRHSLLRIADTDADIAGFGHGEAVVAGAQARIRAARDPFAH